MHYYVYVLKSVVSGRFYIGSSEDPERRLQEHNEGKTVSTRPFIPYTMIYCEQYSTKKEALHREIQIKKSGLIRKQLKDGTYMAPSSNG